MDILDVCPVCGCNDTEFYTKSKDYLISQKDFSIVKCTDCGFLLTNPRPSADLLGDFYQSNEYISHTDSKNSIFDQIYHYVRIFMLRKKLSFINSYLKGNIKHSKLMDYGCGTGEFLIYAKQRGFEVFGIEPNLNARKRASSKGINVEPELIFSPKNTIAFHVITLWHVLEHISDPKHIISEMERVLEKDGLIVVAVPEYLSYDSKYYKKDWAAWDVPRHLNHFNKDTLSKLFYSHGFKLEKIFPLIFDSFYVSLLSEKNRKSGLPGFLRAFIVGLISNVSALFNKTPYSSQVYIFRK